MVFPKMYSLKFILQAFVVLFQLSASFFFSFFFFVTSPSDMSGEEDGMCDPA